MNCPSLDFAPRAPCKACQKRDKPRHWCLFFLGASDKRNSKKLLQQPINHYWPVLLLQFRMNVLAVSRATHIQCLAITAGFWTKHLLPTKISQTCCCNRYHTAHRTHVSSVTAGGAPFRSSCRGLRVQSPGMAYESNYYLKDLLGSVPLLLIILITSDIFCPLHLLWYCS